MFLAHNITTNTKCCEKTVLLIQPNPPNPLHVQKNATQPNPTDGWTQPMSVSDVPYKVKLQESALPQRDRATRHVSQNLVNCRNKLYTTNSQQLWRDFLSPEFGTKFAEVSSFWRYPNFLTHGVTGRRKPPCQKPARFVQSFSYNTGLWRTGRRTDDDRQYRTDIASRGKKWDGRVEFSRLHFGCQTLNAPPNFENSKYCFAVFDLWPI